MKTRITWHIDGIVDSNKNASLVICSDSPEIEEKAIRSFAKTSVHPHRWHHREHGFSQLEEYN
jgi:hypothetical protein